MKFLTKKSTLQKIVFIMIIILLGSFALAPYGVYAAEDDDDDDGWSLGGTLVKEIMKLFTWICDIITGGLNNFMLGANGFGSSMLSQDDPNLTNKNSWLYVTDEEEKEAIEKGRRIVFEDGEIDTSITKWFDEKFSIPNMLYSPENIFANNIAALDVNFLRKNTYNSIYVEGNTKFEENAEEKSKSSVDALRSTLAGWYKSFRNIAVVGLLSVLIYLGIRILISSAASDKAKYKETLKDWAVALCLVFVIHFIMSGVLMLTDKCTELFRTSVDEGYVVVVKDSDNPDPTKFHTNLMGLIRFSAQNHAANTSAVYSIMYWALVIYTCIFTVMYFKRFLYMAFFTMIAPLVALTYPIDKVGDGKSQAFNMWFKEYTVNAIIQPVHLILYTVFVGSAYELVAKNPIYALVALAFLIPAEKFVKKMFGLDKAESTSGFGSFAGGALAMSGLKHLAGLGPGDKGKKGKDGGSGENDSDSSDSIWMPSKDSGKMKTFSDGNTKEQNGHSDISDNMQENSDKPQSEEDEGDDGVIRDRFTDDDSRVSAIDRYNNEGYSQNISGEYFNPNTDEYDANYNPLNDPLYSEQSNPLIDNDNSPELSQINSNTRNTPNDQEETQKPKSVIKSATGAVKKRAQAAGRQVWKSKGKIAKRAVGFAAKTGMRAVGAAAFAAPALAAGITTGDLSKTAQFMSAGALAGSSLGGGIYNRAVVPATKGIINEARNFREEFEEERYGLEGAQQRERERQNAKAKKEFMNNEKEIKRYRELAAKMNYNGDVKDLMESASDYKAEGITDDKLIQNAIKAEYKRDGKVKGNSHEQFVDMAAFAHKNDYGKEYIDDDKKRTSLENVLSSKISDTNKQREAAQTYAEIFDRGDMYKKVGTLGKPAAPKKPSK